MQPESFQTTIDTVTPVVTMIEDVYVSSYDVTIVTRSVSRAGRIDSDHSSAREWPDASQKPAAW